MLAGGADFWSNGIYLSLIEAAEAQGLKPADESWANINAIDDLARHRELGHASDANPREAASIGLTP